MIHHRTKERVRGAELLYEADRMRRRTWWLRACGALAALFGALAQTGDSPALGGIMLAGGLMLLAVAEEVRRKAVTMSREARRAARRQIAEEPTHSEFVDYLSELVDRHRAA